MSLSFHWSLTTAQARLLAVCAFGHYERKDGHPKAPMMPKYDSPFFMATANSLLKKGLLTHDAGREPTWQATPGGVQIAHLIVSDAHGLVRLSDTAKPMPKVVTRSKAGSKK